MLLYDPTCLSPRRYDEFISHEFSFGWRKRTHVLSSTRTSMSEDDQTYNRRRNARTFRQLEGSGFIKIPTSKLSATDCMRIIGFAGHEFYLANSYKAYAILSAWFPKLDRSAPRLMDVYRIITSDYRKKYVNHTIQRSIAERFL